MLASSSYLVIVNNLIDTDDDSIWRVSTIESAVHPSFTLMAWRAPKVPRQPTENSRCKSIAGRIFDWRFIHTLTTFARRVRMHTHGSCWLTERFKNVHEEFENQFTFIHLSFLKTIYLRPLESRDIPTLRANSRKRKRWSYFRRTNPSLHREG